MKCRLVVFVLIMAPMTTRSQPLLSSQEDIMNSRCFFALSTVPCFIDLCYNFLPQTDLFPRKKTLY